MRPLFEHHRDLIVAGLTATPGVAQDEDTCAGFLNGFLTVRAHIVADGSVEQESMFPVLGGLYLAALALQDTDPADTARDGEFFEGLAGALDGEAAVVASAAELLVWQGRVRAIFATTPDVPISQAALAGFVLGVMYAGQFLPDDDVHAGVLFATVRHMAQDLYC